MSVEWAPYEAGRRAAQHPQRTRGRRWWHRLAYAAAVLVAGCADDGGGGGGAAGAGGCPSDLPSDAACPGIAPSYADVVAPILERRCQGCHYPQNPFSRVVLSDYPRTFAARRTALSMVYGCRMPPAEATPLSAQERGALLAWLVCGAPEN